MLPKYTYGYPAIRRDRMMIVSMDSVYYEVIHLVPILREEGFSEKYFFELSAIARNKVEDTNLHRIGIGYTPKLALEEILHEEMVVGHLLSHLGPLQTKEVLNAAWEVSMRSYYHFDQVIRHYGLGEPCSEEFDIFVDDWIDDNDLILAIVYK